MTGNSPIWSALAHSRRTGIELRDVRAWRNGRRNGLRTSLSALRETGGAELLKFGETCKMAIPSQARRREGVETRRAAPTAQCYGEGMVQTTNSRSASSVPRQGGESRGGMKIRRAKARGGSSPPVRTIMIVGFREPSSTAFAHSHRSGGQEIHRDSVDAVAEMRGRRTIVEHVPEMASAVRAMNLGAHHAVASIHRRFHRPLDRVIETGPASTTLELPL